PRIGPGCLQQIRHEARGNRDAGTILLVRPHVGEIGQHGSYAPGRRVLERVDRYQELDDSVRNRRTGGLNYEDVCLPDVFIDLDEHVLIGEAHDCRVAEVGSETLADGLGQFWMGGAADQLDGSDHVPLLCSLHRATYPISTYISMAPIGVARASRTSQNRRITTNVTTRTALIGSIASLLHLQ